MNENIDLTKILKNCPKGWKFYSLIYGEVEFSTIIKDDTYPIIFIAKYNSSISIMSNGRHVELFDGECTLFPSKDQRDWSKFSAPWYKKEKFDPKTLNTGAIGAVDPKLSWINIKDDLPCNHEELINTQDNSTKKVIVVDKYDGVIVDFMRNINRVWYWRHSVKALYWMPIPKLPKENRRLNYD